MSHEATIQGVGVTMEGGVGTPVVVLKARGELVPIYVSDDQARAIEQALQNAPVKRPMTHDLLTSVLEDADVSIERVRIDDLANGTFHAKVDLAVDRGQESREVIQDARPSDGLALAVRVDCPVRVADHVVDEAGRAPESFGIDQLDQIGDGRHDLGVGAEDRYEEATSPDEPQASIDLDDAVAIEFDEEGNDDDAEFE